MMAAVPLLSFLISPRIYTQQQTAHDAEAEANNGDDSGDDEGDGLGGDDDRRRRALLPTSGGRRAAGGGGGEDAAAQRQRKIERFRREKAGKARLQVGISSLWTGWMVDVRCVCVVPPCVPLSSFLPIHL